MTGAIVHQATAVAVKDCALLIEGPPGSGKSTLALQLIDRGAILIGDDGVTLELRASKLWAKSPPNITGKLEVRNLGIIDLPTTEAPVALVLRLTSEAPRFIESARAYEIAGTSVPLIDFDPAIAAAPARAEWALRLYGMVG